MEIEVNSIETAIYLFPIVTCYHHFSSKLIKNQYFCPTI